MIAVGVGYDVVFVVHLVAALATVSVLVALRTNSSLAASTPLDVLRRRFPDRVDWAVRVVHLLPVTGIVMAATGGSDVSLARAWVSAGLGIYLVLAWWLEARTLTLERSFARALAGDGAPPEGMARSLTRRIDVALALVAAALVAMVVQF